MVDRKAEKKFFAKKRFDLNVRVVGDIADQGQIDFVLLELTDELVGGLLVEDQLGSWIFLPKEPNNFWKEIRSDGGKSAK